MVCCSGIGNFFKNLGVRIFNAIGNTGSLLYSKGKELIAGFMRGVKDRLGSGPLGKLVGGALGITADILNIDLTPKVDTTKITKDYFEQQRRALGQAQLGSTSQVLNQLSDRSEILNQRWRQLLPAREINIGASNPVIPEQYAFATTPQGGAPQTVIIVEGNIYSPEEFLDDLRNRGLFGDPRFGENAQRYGRNVR